MISNRTFQTILDLNLDPIKVKLMHVESGEGWSLHRVNAVEREYRRFLFLMKTFPNEHTAPLVDVDIFWHYHILDTLKYAVDCDAIFGYFLHHFPYIGLRGEEDKEALALMGERMGTLYEATFGEDYVRAEVAAETPAYCATAAAAAYCATSTKAVNATAAYCATGTKAVNATAAYCATGTKAAYCAANAAPAYCATSNKAAYCAANVAPAYCATSTKAAYCAANVAPAYCATSTKAAYCAANVAPAYCATSTKAAYCATIVESNRAGTTTRAANCAMKADDDMIPAAFQDVARFYSERPILAVA
jgi:hypothetical protein